MAAAKKSIPLPMSSRKVAQGALMLAITVLQDERVRAQLRRAPATAKQWADQLRDGSDPNVLGRFDPTRRFGQRGIERRLNALQANVRLAFPDPSGRAAVAVYQAIDDLDRATAISATMPVTKRRTAHARISAEIDRLESALVDAVLDHTP